jgi:tryptophanyl-tRNA synthetase
VTIYAALAGETKEAVLGRFAGQGFGAFKPALAEVAVAALSPITAELRRLLADPAEVDRVLADGAERAREIAAPVLAEVKAVVGFWSPKP